MGLAVGGFLVFLEFLPLFFQFISLHFLSPLGPGGVGGNTAGGGLSRVGFGSRCCDGSPLFPVLSLVTVGHWMIGRPRNGSGGGLLELPLYRFLGFLVLALPMVYSTQRQQGSRLGVLGTNCSLHESEVRLCPEVVLDWFPRFPIRGVLGMPILGNGRWLCAVPLVMAG